MDSLVKNKRIQASGNTLEYILYHDDYPITPINSVWNDTAASTDKIYVVQTSNEIIKRCILIATSPGDLIFDPTCGSGTTAFVAEQWGEKMDYLRYIKSSNNTCKATSYDSQV